MFHQQDPSSSFSNTRQSAIRLRHLPPGTVQFENIIESNVLGSIIQETKNSDPGLIAYIKEGQQKSIIFFAKDCDVKIAPKIGDKVQLIFSLSTTHNF